MKCMVIYQILLFIYFYYRKYLIFQNLIQIHYLVNLFKLFYIRVNIKDNNCYFILQIYLLSYLYENENSLIIFP